jgi:hypothetical protein
VKVVDAGQAPYVVGQNGLVAYAEVNINYSAGRSPRTSFRNTKIDTLTDRCRAGAIGQTQTIRRVVGSARLQNRWCKCIVGVDRASAP